MTRDEFLGRVTDLIRRSGVDDGEELIAELERQLNYAQQVLELVQRLQVCKARLPIAPFSSSSSV